MRGNRWRRLRDEFLLERPKGNDVLPVHQGDRQDSGGRCHLDAREPYSSTAVTGIQADFFEFQPERKFDFVLCLQVLEHIEDATRFARRLFDVADCVLISVPHKWPSGACKAHVQDPVDAEKVRTWMGRRPDYEIPVTEPMRWPRTAGRLIQYYGPVGERFKLSAAREHAIAIWTQRHKEAVARAPATGVAKAGR